MPNRIHRLLTSTQRALVAGVLVASTATLAEAQLVVYDDFAAGRIDESRWAGRQLVNKEDGTGSLLEIQREVTSAQALVLQTRVVGGTDAAPGSYSVDNALMFRHAQAFDEIAFDVAVRRVDVRGCAAGANAEASARGVFALFNDGIGDVVATVGVTRSSALNAAAAELDVVASLVHRTDEGDTMLGVLSLGPATLGRQVRLRVRWDPARNRVRFQRDADAVVAIDYTNPVVAPPGSPRKYLAATASVSDCSVTGASAAITAAFDNVRVNQ